MSKRIAFLVLVIVFGLGALVGLRAPSVQAAAPCYITCICGTPYKCCTTSSGTTCTVYTGRPIICPLAPCQ